MNERPPGQRRRFECDDGGDGDDVAGTLAARLKQEMEKLLVVAPPIPSCSSVSQHQHQHQHQHQPRWREAAPSTMKEADNARRRAALIPSLAGAWSTPMVDGQAFDDLLELAVDDDVSITLRVQSKTATAGGTSIHPHVRPTIHS